MGRGGLTLLPVLVAEAVLEPLLPSISTRQGFTQKTAGLTYADLARVFTYKPTAILLNKAYTTLQLNILPVERQSSENIPPP